jgi:hypothetical protein
MRRPGEPAGDLFFDILRVRTVPVHLVTRGTQSEAILCQVDVWRDALKDGFFIDVFQEMVAVQAPRE